MEHRRCQGAVKDLRGDEGADTDLFEDAVSRHLRGIDFLFFSSRRRHTRLQGDWSSDVCSSDLLRDSRWAERFARLFETGRVVTAAGFIGHGTIVLETRRRELWSRARRPAAKVGTEIGRASCRERV